MSARELIAAIVDDPDEEGAWRVYADWLLERGDVRGELIHLAFDPSSEATWRIRRLEMDEELLLSPGLFAQHRHWYFTYRRGFIETAKTDAALPFSMAALEALGADPHAVLLEQLSIYGVHDAEAIPVVQDLGDPSKSLEAFRYLERLHFSDIQMSRLSHPHLRKLEQFRAGGTFSHTGLFGLPELTDWSLFADEALFTTTTSMLFQPPPRLRWLTISLTPNQIALLADLPIIRQLHTLTLEFNEPEALLVLRDHAASFAGLRSIEIPYVISANDVAAARELRSELERAFPNTKLEIDWQHFLGALVD